MCGARAHTLTHAVYTHLFWFDNFYCAATTTTTVAVTATAAYDDDDVDNKVDNENVLLTSINSCVNCYDWINSLTLSLSDVWCVVCFVSISWYCFGLFRSLFWLEPNLSQTIRSYSLVWICENLLQLDFKTQHCTHSRSV